jgi:tetratricopeptide (TPR) repeat protein
MRIDMPIKNNLACRLMVYLMIAGAASAGYSQAKKTAASVSPIEIRNYKLEATLIPDSHQIKAAATIAFMPLESIDHVVFELSENLLVRNVLNSEDKELRFSQEERNSSFLTVQWDKPLVSGTEATLRIEYEGGFDRDRYSRLYARDEGSAYIGMEGTYLMYSSKWVPIHQFLAGRATQTLEVTVPLGMTVIGAGTQLPVVTRGINETFRWVSKTPTLPGSFVAGQYFPKHVQAGEFTIDCFAKESVPDPMQKMAEAAAQILEYYRAAYGPAASGSHFRLVEVDEHLVRQPGMMGTIFVTRNELAQSKPPIRELARRIACQWWQETVGIPGVEDLWLVDGMAYFSAAQYIRNAEGAAAYKEEIDNLEVLALKFENRSSVRRGWDLGYRTDRYESVVAGKGAWILVMLRGILGEARFNQLISQYLHEYAGRSGGSAAFAGLAEKIYGQELGWFFSEWIDTTGVPAFQADYVIYKTANGFRVSGTVKQDRDLFRMPVEIAVLCNGKEEVKTVDLSGKSTSFDIATFSMPQKVILDPGNKLLRDSKELQTSVQLSLASDLKQKGDFVEAIRAYEKALQISPHRSLAHFRMAEVFFEQSNLQTAANSFRDALNGDKDPKWIEVWCYIYIGKIYDILGQRQRAIAEYTKAVNTKDDTNGAQAEADKWLTTPYTQDRAARDSERKQ